MWRERVRFSGRTALKWCLLHQNSLAVYNGYGAKCKELADVGPRSHDRDEPVLYEAADDRRGCARNRHNKSNLAAASGRSAHELPRDPVISASPAGEGSVEPDRGAGLGNCHPPGLRNAGRVFSRFRERRRFIPKGLVSGCFAGPDAGIRVAQNGKTGALYYPQLRVGKACPWKSVITTTVTSRTRLFTLVCIQTRIGDFAFGNVAQGHANWSCARLVQRRRSSVP